MSLRLYNPYVPPLKQGEANSIAGMHVVGTPEDRNVLVYSGDRLLTWMDCHAPTGPQGPTGLTGATGATGRRVLVDTATAGTVDPETSITFFQPNVALYPSSSLGPSSQNGFQKTIAYININQWNPAGSGWLGQAYAVAASGPDLVYLGGNGSVNGTSIQYLAQANSANQWSAIAPSTPLDGPVRCLQIINKATRNLWIGGNFSNHIRTWDFSSSSLVTPALGGPTTNNILAISDGPGNIIYVGCDSSPAYNGAIFPYDTATNTWGAALGGGVLYSSLSTSTQVRALAYDPVNNKLYLGGVFTSPSSCVVAYNIATGLYETMNGGVGGGPSPAVNTLTLYGGYLYVGGSFTTINLGTTADACANIARFNISTGQWEAVNVSGLPAPVTAIEANAYNSLLFAATNANLLYAFNLPSLSISHIVNVTSAAATQIYDITSSADRVVAAGDFSLINAVPASSVAYYDVPYGYLTGAFHLSATPHTQIRFNNFGNVVMNWLSNENTWAISSNTNVSLL